jgi:hypothetical protein
MVKIALETAESMGETLREENGILRESEGYQWLRHQE